VLQWPFLDFGNPGINKMLVGFDIAGFGQVSAQIGCDQRDFSALTTAYTISAADTVPGTPVPLPVTAPSFSLRLTFAANQTWGWDFSNLYIAGNAYGAGSIG
jgi:hypothetical protein